MDQILDNCADSEMSLNPNPVVTTTKLAPRKDTTPSGERDIIDAREIFDIVCDINDPEHPLTLEQLNVIEEKNIDIDDGKSYLKVLFTPTIPHCSMATLIGLSIRVLLLRSLPVRYKVCIRLKLSFCLFFFKLHTNYYVKLLIIS